MIKLHSLQDDALIDDSVHIELQGIHKNSIKTLGQTILTLQLDNISKEYIFHVVPKEIRLRTDGVIGRNLLVYLKANIDYGDRLLRVGLSKIPLCNPLIKLSPRTEQFVQVLVNRNGDGLIEETEIEAGVYIPCTVVTANQNKASVVVVNTSNREVNVTKVQCEISKLNECTPKLTAGDVQTYLNTDHLSLTQQSAISKVCREYRDIFYLPGDKLTSTKTIEHEITLHPSM